MDRIDGNNTAFSKTGERGDDYITAGSKRDGPI